MKDDSMAKGDSVYSGSIKNITAYKVAISIIFGLLGFAVNFHTLNFAFPPYTATVLIGLLFPMLITLAWGWKYGLLSALVGGCQSMWWLWGPSNGYATFLVVPPFTLWIVWHGLVSNLRRKQADHRWWLSKYAVEVPFRILSTINLYTLSRWAITLNPPPWNWASGAPNTIPMRFSNFVVIKQAAVGYVILLLADILLNLGFVRRFFRLKEDYDQANTGYITSASLLLGVLFWLVDSVIGSLVFHAERSFLDLLALDVPPDQVYVRTFFTLTCLVGGLLASKLLRRQRESDRALQESERRLSQIVEGSSIPVFVIDQEHTVTHWNKACENLTGVPASEMIGTQKQWSPFYSVERPVMADLIVDEPTEEDIAKYYGGKYQKSALIEGAYEAEDFFPGFDDTWLFFTAAPLRAHQGKVVGAIETLRDVTERKRAEEALREYSERLEEMVEDRTKELHDAQEQLVRREKLAVLGQLAGGVGHELRNPLGVISNAVYFLHTILPDADETTREYLGIISSEVRDADKIVSDLLDFSRTRLPDREKIAVSDLVTQVLAKRPPPENVKVTVEVPADLPPVFVDPRQIGQVLGNLVTNAYQAMPEGGRLMIHASEGEGIGRHGDTGTGRPGDDLPITPSPCLRVSISDTGCGIPSENMKKLFEPLFTTRAKGIGLGLAVSKNLVEANGGSIEVKSKVGKGSAFTVWLPLAEQGLGLGTRG